MSTTPRATAPTPATPPPGQPHPQHGDEGNLIKKTNIDTGDYVEYDWDQRNRLVAVSFRNPRGTLTKKVEYDYDAFNRLIHKRADDNGNGTIDRAQKFVYDGTATVLVFDDNDSLTNRLLPGPAVDQFFADEDALGEVLWLLGDHQNSVRDVVDYNAVTGTSSVVNHLQYSSFGEITDQTAPSKQPLRRQETAAFNDAEGKGDQRQVKSRIVDFR